MLSPNLTYILFSEQWFTVYGLVFNLNVIQSTDLSALDNAGSSSKKFNVVLFTLSDFTRTDPTQFYLKLPDPDPTCIFASRHNTIRYWMPLIPLPDDRNLLPDGIIGLLDQVIYSAISPHPTPHRILKLLKIKFLKIIMTLIHQSSSMHYFQYRDWTPKTTTSQQSMCPTLFRLLLQQPFSSTNHSYFITLVFPQL